VLFQTSRTAAKSKCPEQVAHASLRPHHVLDARLHVAAEVAVVLVGHVGRHEHLDVLPDRLLRAVPERLCRTLVVLFDDALLIDLMGTVSV
jgi:hypothetical protein